MNTESNINPTALVTGATSGLGLEAAAQLAEAGYSKVTITGRTPERAESALRRLVERTGLHVFEALALDLNDPASVDVAASELESRGVAIDFLLLNAGMVSGNELVKTDAGVEITFSSSLIGHHQLTQALLGSELLAEGAHIVIAGSEAARGDVPTFKTIDLSELAEDHFDGQLEAAAGALMRGEAPIKYKAGNTYATAKVFVAWWAASLSRRLPEGITVTAVSPGSAPNTDAARNANFFMKRIMMPVMKHAPARFGLAATTESAASRYLEASEFGPEASGHFYASAPKKMTGPIERMTQPQILDVESQEAAWSATVHLAETIAEPSVT
jgi:NAD(P)-dependent dehydrogenase (short-subunit alcohol dehydrogenase family)